MNSNSSSTSTTAGVSSPSCTLKNGISIIIIYIALMVMYGTHR